MGFFVVHVIGLGKGKAQSTAQKALFIQGLQLFHMLISQSPLACVNKTKYILDQKLLF